MSLDGRPERRFLILHGLDNHRPRDHWQWWLTEALRRRGEQVLYPQFPDADRPQLGRWLELLAAEYAQLGDGQRVVVCHSLACALWFQASMQHTLDRRADRVLLVAPPGPSFLAQPPTAAFYDPGWTGNVLRTSSHAPIRLVASDNDRFCPEGPAEIVYARSLGFDAETMPGAGHLTPADGFGPWPEVLRWCTDEASTFTSNIVRLQPDTNASSTW